MSLDAQRAKLAAYCSALDLELVEVIADEGASAKSLARPGLQRALRLLESGDASTLLVAKLDRLTRSLRDLDDLTRRYFSGERFALLSVGESLDTRTAMGRFVLYILGLIAQWEREAISERTREAMMQIKTTGYQFGQPPFGWRRGGVDEHGRVGFVEDEEQRQGLRRVLELFDAGAGVEQIIATLAAEGIGSSRGCARWQRPAVYRLLRREGRLPERLRETRPRGYQIIPQHDRARSVAVAQALRAQGLSLRQICAALHAQCLPPPGGRRWHASTLWSLLGYQRG